MKVIESLFKNYLQTSAEDHIQKYLAARAVLEITDKDATFSNELTNKSHRLSDRFPLSIFIANDFLKDKSTKLNIKIEGRNVTIDKGHGDDYFVRQAMSQFILEVNKAVILSMDQFNTDRGRSQSATKLDEDMFS